MSTGTRLPWAEAMGIAERLHADLTPYVVRVKAAGSLRRRKATVGDIEFVVEAPMATSDLFGGQAPAVEPIRAIAAGWGAVQKAGEKLIQVTLPQGINVDIYVVTPPAQWGSILAIRTGPGDLGKHAVTIMRDRGILHREGHVETERCGITIPTPDEESFFWLAGLPCLPPAQRDDPRAMRPLPRSEKPICLMCREPMDHAALLYGETRVLCTTCHVSANAGRTPSAKGA
jgi:DNA polymerase (family 10)